MLETHIYLFLTIWQKAANSEQQTTITTRDTIVFRHVTDVWWCCTIHGEMEMDHLRWCFDKIFTQNVTSKDLSCPNCLSAISEGYKDKISTWGGDVDLLKCLNGFLKKEVKVLFREISLWYCSNLSNKVKHCLHVCNTRHYCIVLLPSHCFTQHYLRFSPCHSIFTQNTAGARQLAAWSYCW